jgi:hypothetical protein
MTLKLIVAIVIGLFAVISIPSVIATFMLLIKGIGALGERRRRPTFYQR